VSIINCRLQSTVSRGYIARINGAHTDGVPLALTASDGTLASGHANVGVFLEDGVSGDMVPVQVAGVCDYVIAGASITIGALATTSAAGKAVAASAGTRACLRILQGWSANGATADGAACRALILSDYYAPAA
jgi:hypothetical protein